MSAKHTPGLRSEDVMEMVAALTRHYWTVAKVSLYDEEGVEGWTWTEPSGEEHTAVGAWDELPPWPDSALAALAKAEARP